MVKDTFSGFFSVYEHLIQYHFHSIASNTAVISPAVYIANTEPAPQDVYLSTNHPMLAPLNGTTNGRMILMRT